MNNISLTFTVARLLHPKEAINIIVTRNSNIRIPADGIASTNNNDFTITVSLFNHTSILTGSVLSVQGVGYFTSKYVTIYNPVANAVTAMAFRWSLSDSMSAGEQVSFFLPGFSVSSSSSAASSFDEECPCLWIRGKFIYSCLVLFDIKNNIYIESSSVGGHDCELKCIG